MFTYRYRHVSFLVSLPVCEVSLNSAGPSQLQTCVISCPFGGSDKVGGRLSPVRRRWTSNTHFLAFRHLPPNSAVIRDATEGTLLISVQNHPINLTLLAPSAKPAEKCEHWFMEAYSVEVRVENEFRLDSNDFGFICAGVGIVEGYDRNADWNNLSCLCNNKRLKALNKHSITQILYIEKEMYQQ